MQIDIGISEQAHEATVRTARDVVAIAEEAGDAASADLATQRLQVHEKTAWMLRSSLEQAAALEVPAYA